MTGEEIKTKLKRELTPKRYVHTLGVMDTAAGLAEKYGENKEKAALTGLLHDCARNIKGELVFKQCIHYNVEVDDISRVQPELLHGPLGAEMARSEYGIDDESILRAIRVHTTGCENMSLLDKIIFIADCIEPGRGYPGVEELRKEAFRDIDSSMLMALDKTIMHVLSKSALIHPDTIRARNYLIFDQMKKQGNKR